MKRPKNDLVEIFGHSPTDHSESARRLWAIGACPFTRSPCTKTNHDSTVVYGTCSVTTTGGTCIICPNRMYCDDYATLKRIATEAFGPNPEFVMYGEYVERRSEDGLFIIPLGHGSGKEVKLGRQMSMDWVLAVVDNGELIQYVGVEVQSIDITGNYRDAWYAYKHLDPKISTTIPKSGHGLNWANVHKRLIPQIIRKGLIYSRSDLVHHGLFFMVPEVVYQKFEGVIGADIRGDHLDSPHTLTVHTYELGEEREPGTIRPLIAVRSLKLSLDEFSQRFINGPNLPAAIELDNAIRRSLGCR